MLKGSILEKLTTRHSQRKNPLHLGVYYKNTLVALCHALEDFILELEEKPLILAAFQQGRWYLQEAQRYGELAKRAAEIVILAVPDTGFDNHPTSNQSNISLVNLSPEDPVAQEWHLMILSPSYSAMVLCQELSPQDYQISGIPTKDVERKFYGFWTFEPDLVRETIALTQEHIAKIQPQLAARIAQTITEIEQTKVNWQSDLASVIVKVVNYLEDSQKNLLMPSNCNEYNRTQELDENILSNKMQAFLRMAEMIDQADAVNPNAAAEVASYAEAMGQILELPAWQIKRLRLAGLLHRLAPLQLTQSSDYYPPRELLRTIPQLETIAKIIIHQHEHWDGSGTPDGLAYDDIPLESRILSLVADFQARLRYHQQELAVDCACIQALADCEYQSNTIYDPKLVETLQLLVMAMQQGMELPSYQPNIVSGIWLLEE